MNERIAAARKRFEDAGRLGFVAFVDQLYSMGDKAPAYIAGTQFDMSDMSLGAPSGDPSILELLAEDAEEILAFPQERLSYLDQQLRALAGSLARMVRASQVSDGHLPQVLFDAPFEYDSSGPPNPNNG